MSGAAYRDEEAALLETRAQLIDARRADEVRAAASMRVLADRVTRVVCGAMTLAAAALLATLDLVDGARVATPDGGTWLGRALVSVPFVALAAQQLLRLRAPRPREFAPSGDVVGDVERLREPLDLAPLHRRSAALERASFVLPLLALGAWPSLLATHLAIELVRAPLRYYELMPSLELRHMAAMEALRQLLMGVAVVSALSFAAYTVAIVRTAGRRFPSGTDSGTTAALAFGGLSCGASLGQLAISWMEESGASIALGYTAIAIGLATGLLGGRSALAWARRIFERERSVTG